MRNVLIIAYYWPPAGGPGVQRWLYFVRYLEAFGVRPILFIPEKPYYPLRDEALCELLPKDLTVYTSRFWEPYALAGVLGRKTTRRVSSGMLDKKQPGWSERLMRWVRGNVFIPDARKFWLRPALRQLPAILEKEQVELVITTGPPHSVHLIGQALQKQGLRWVADFRDPWTDIGYHEYMYLGRRARRRHQQLEAGVLGSADALITTSHTTAEAFRNQTTQPVHVVTNGYDQEPGNGAQPEGPFRLVFIGSLLAGRNPTALWEAIRWVAEADKAFRDRIQISLTGLISEEARQHLQDTGVWEWVDVHPYIPHAAAMAQLRQAQILLLPEIDTPQTKGILPGKLFEYMAAARPILAIGPEGWEAARIVQETGTGAAFAHGETEAIATQLKQWFDTYQKGELTGNTAKIAPYHRKALTGKLVNEVLWASS